MKLFTILFCAGLLMMSAGCTGTQPKVILTGDTYPPTKPESIQIIADGKPTRPYVEIARITVPNETDLDHVPYATLFVEGRSGEEITRLIKQQASELGADAVINITSDITGTSGVAIKYKDN